MALQFIFGGSGSGKSHYLYERITREAGENPALTYIVLVPEQFTMQTQRELVERNVRKGIMNIDVLSFGRLAHRVFEETGKGDAAVLDDEGKNLVLRKIAAAAEPELSVLKGNMKRLGYISEVKSVLSEFDQYDIGIEELEQVMESVGRDASLYYKLKDMKRIYEGFQEYLKDRYITKEELLDVLCGAVPESLLLRKSIVVLDGFTGFTPVQNRLLAELMKVCLEVVITVTIDGSEDPYMDSHPYQMFGLSKHMVSALTGIAEECRVEQKKPVWMKGRPYYRFRECGPLAFLEEHLFRYGKKQYKGVQEAVRIYTARYPREEVAAAASEVRRMVRERGLRYREIGVIVTDMDSYGDDLERMFSRYDIPVFMDYKRSILLNSFVEYVRSILAMVEENFTYESVFRFLRAGYGPFSDDDTDALENYCLALGIRGYKRWQQRWVRREKDMTEPELELVNHLRVELVERMDGLVFVLKQRKKTVRDITEALYSFLEQGQLQQALKRQEEEFAARGEQALAKEYAQVYRVVIELFDKFVELLGEEPVSLKEYCELLDAGLNEAKIGVIPPGADQVIVGDVERTRLKDIKALLVLGVNDTLLPGQLVHTGILNERDREKFQLEKLALTPGGREQAYIQKFYLYQDLTKPEESLYLFYSKSAADGKALRPAYLIGEIKRLFPEISVTDVAKVRLAGKELTPQTAIGELIQGLRQQSAEGGSAWMELYNWYKKNPAWAEKIAQILEAGFYSYQPEKISQMAAGLLYGEHFQSSVSRMEQFSACAFSHFLTYGLRLKERKEYDFQALDLGNVFHSAIERYSRKVEQSGEGWAGIEDTRRKQLVGESVEEAVADYGNQVLYSSARNEYMIVRLTRLLDRTVWALTDQLGRGDFVPDSYELDFGSGKIDRMDLCQDKDEVYVKVLDYKTGQAGFDISALCYGLQLQLMVYMNAAAEYVQKRYPGREVIPAGVFYYRMKDPLVEKKEEGVKEEDLLKEFCLDGIVNLEKESLNHLDHTFQGESTVVPVKRNKDGSLSKWSKAVGREEFDTMLSFAEKKKGSLRTQIRQGDIVVHPYRRGTETGCDYCMYRHICGFDSRLPGYEYRNVRRLSKEEALADMKRELADGGEELS